MLVKPTAQQSYSWVHRAGRRAVHSYRDCDGKAHYWFGHMHAGHGIVDLRKTLSLVSPWDDSTVLTKPFP